MSPLAPAARARTGHGSRLMEAVVRREFFKKVRRLSLFMVLFGFWFFCSDVFLVFFGDLGLLCVALVQINTVAEGDAFAGGDREISSRLILEIFEVMLAERVGGE